VVLAEEPNLAARGLGYALPQLREAEVKTLKSGATREKLVLTESAECAAYLERKVEAAKSANEVLELMAEADLAAPKLKKAKNKVARRRGRRRRLRVAGGRRPQPVTQRAVATTARLGPPWVHRARRVLPLSARASWATSTALALPSRLSGVGPVGGLRSQSAMICARTALLASSEAGAGPSSEPSSQACLR
jgi:hypothetical protein